MRVSLLEGGSTASIHCAVVRLQHDRHRLWAAETKVASQANLPSSVTTGQVCAGQERISVAVTLITDASSSRLMGLIDLLIDTDYIFKRLQHLRLFVAMFNLSSAGTQYIQPGSQARRRWHHRCLPSVVYAVSLECLTK